HHTNAAGHDRSNGRIFQVRYGDVKPVKVDLRKLSDLELVKLQLHPNDWYCRHARRLLQERTWAAQQSDLKPPRNERGRLIKNRIHIGQLDEKVYPELEAIVLKHPDETRQLRALWALAACGGLELRLVSKLLASDRPFVRAWTVYFLVEG